VLVVLGDSPAVERMRELAGALSHAALPCPARRLELVAISPAAAAAAPGARPFELNLNTGADGADHAGLDPADEPAHWFVIDRAIARARGRSLDGPPPREVLAPVPRAELLSAVRDSLAWYGEHEPASPDAVLSACRGWRWARTGHWTSKDAAADWARTRMSDPAVVEAARAARAAGTELDPAQVASFLAAASAAVQAVRP